VHHGVHARREIAICNKGWRGHHQSGGGRQQTLVNTAGKLRDRRVTATGRDRAKCVDHSSNGAKQAQQWREKSDRSQHSKKSLQFWHLKLGGFLHNVAQFCARRIVLNDGGMNHPRHRARCSSRFM
jgi:hypothetical protein